MTEPELRARLDAVQAELARGGWPVERVPDDAPESVLLARVVVDERRLRVMGEAS